jgi:superfamily I DNA/RNA helicase
MAQAVAYAEHLFAQRGTIKMMTGHKAKGGEWPIVFHLDPWLIGYDEQELNLRYVISTRAKEALYEIDSQNIRWSA